MESQANSFASLASLLLPTPARLFATACCPDKDLVALVVSTKNNSNKDKLSLWKLQGSKVWEVDVTPIDASSKIVGLAWSPNGQSIAVAHDPPKITVHSIQDGSEGQSLTLGVPLGSQRTARITDIWWLSHGEEKEKNNIPDVFGRKGVITGSAHSILKMLPLLDPLDSDKEAGVSSNLFAFQGSETKAARKPELPEAIHIWPHLQPDPVLASIATPLLVRQQELGRKTIEDEADSHLNTLLVAADDMGYLHYYLDGSYPLGAVLVRHGTSVTCLSKDIIEPKFYGHLREQPDETKTTNASPVVIKLQLLETRRPRDVALLSTSARELLWYAMRTVREMRTAWFGSEAQTGARELGPRWLRALETTQREQFGVQDPNSILDLTTLLITGRGSESLLDYLGSGDNMSERGIDKWETTVSDALGKMRDLSETRLAPAFQRLHLILEELQGMSDEPNFGDFKLEKTEITHCLDLAARAIVISAWLAAFCRRELAKFTEFIEWLRFEVTVLSPNSTGTRPAVEHDILEVNNYIMSGLMVSSIDKWFMGPVPRFMPQDLGVPSDDYGLHKALASCHTAIHDKKSLEWQGDTHRKDLSHLDRNLDALTQELATRCQRVLFRASGAVGRSAVIAYPLGPKSGLASAEQKRPNLDHNLLTRDRVIVSDVSGGSYQYLAMFSKEFDFMLCMIRQSYGRDTQVQQTSSVAMIDCSPVTTAGSGSTSTGGSVQQFDFFDDETLVLVYDTGDERGTVVVTATYHDARYQELLSDTSGSSREHLAAAAFQEWRAGHVLAGPIQIRRSRALPTITSANVALAVNGRVGRRVAVVLDGDGTGLEMLDLEGDEDDEDDAEDEEGPEEDEEAASE